MEEKFMNTLLVLITMSVISIAVTNIVDSNKTLSRDFNQDGVVDIVDLSIMAAEISTRNENK
jgi:hypothetical protein